MNQKQKKIKTKIKPIELDAHLRYKCPNHNCGYDHWLSLKETQTKNFRVVCDCGFIFKPKRIKFLKTIYIKHKQIKQSSVVDKPTQEKLEEKTLSNIKPLDKSILDDCVKIMIGYGFTKSESVELINKSYESTKIANIGSLVKNALLIIGGNCD